MKRSYIKGAIAAFMAGILIALLDALLLEKYFFQVRRFDIGKKNSDKMIKILLLTDLHFINRLWLFHRRLADKINELNPDLILVAGDIIDVNGVPGPAKRFFGLVKTSIPKLAVPGNHDHKNKVSRRTLKNILEQHNGHLLVNETKQLLLQGILFTITGLDDFIEGEGGLADAVSAMGTEEHHLLLVHSPLQQEAVRKDISIINSKRTDGNRLTIQYIFAGHSHGGQVRFGPFIPVRPRNSGNYIKGWYNKEKPFLYVSKGFGTTAVPFRFGARAEVTLFSYGV